jgi:hypothetical protein
VRTIHAALGDALVSSLRAEGRAMTLEQAIEYALNVVNDTARGS